MAGRQQYRDPTSTQFHDIYTSIEKLTKLVKNQEQRIQSLEGENAAIKSSIKDLRDMMRDHQTLYQDGDTILAGYRDKYAQNWAAHAKVNLAPKTADQIVTRMRSAPQQGPFAQASHTRFTEEDEMVPRYGGDSMSEFLGGDDIDVRLARTRLH